MVGKLYRLVSANGLRTARSGRDDHLRAEAAPIVGHARAGVSSFLAVRAMLQAPRSESYGLGGHGSGNAKLQIGRSGKYIYRAACPERTIDRVRHEIPIVFRNRTCLCIAKHQFLATCLSSEREPFSGPVADIWVCSLLGPPCFLCKVPLIAGSLGLVASHRVWPRPSRSRMQPSKRCPQGVHGCV